MRVPRYYIFQNLSLIHISVKIVKTPGLDFKDMEQSEEIIEGDALDSWLSELF